jgi:hypothetical protein
MIQLDKHTSRRRKGQQHSYLIVVVSVENFGSVDRQL